MRVGVLQFFSGSREGPLADVYRGALERIGVMDRSGYDAVWLAEHHFTRYSVCPAVHVMAAYVAAHTRRLRIGTAVSVAALYHPLRLAEDVAMLDVLSGGRVNFGAGRGFEPAEFRHFGVPLEESAERFREAVEIVLAAWQSEQLDWSGRFWQFSGVEVLPRPLQQPHPPTWVAASSPPALAWAASRGLDILMDPHATCRELAHKRELYRAQLEAHGHALAGRTLPIARFIAVGETQREAEEIARRGARWTVGAYAHPKRPHEIAAAAAAGIDPIERYVGDVILWGTADALVERLAQLREELGLEYLLCAPLGRGSFERFTERVLPRLA